MNTRGWSVGALFMFASLGTVAQVGIWKNYTSMKEVRGVAKAGNTFWAATSGGLFAMQEVDKTFRRLTNAEGLLSIDLTAVAVDDKGDIWSGTSFGHVHVYSPSSGTWRYITNIAEDDNETNKRINSFTMHGDTVLICTDFGLSMFSISGFQFGDTYRRFGNLPANVRVTVSSAAIFNGRIWATVASGSTSRIASADLSDPNILPAEAWTLHTVGSGAVMPKTLSLFNGKLYTGTSNGVFFLVDSTWDTISVLGGINIVATAGSPSSLLVCSPTDVYSVDVQNGVTAYGTALPTPYTATSITTNSVGDPIIGSSSGGLLDFLGNWLTYHPNGPNGNTFVSVAVDPDGNVWGASGSANGKGFYRFNGTEWRSFTRENSPLPTNEYYRVSVGCNESVWASSWGSGFVEMLAGSDQVDPNRIFGTNVGIVGIPGDTNYIVATTVACDRVGNVWMSSQDAANTRILAVRRPDATWLTFPVFLNGVPVKLLHGVTPNERALVVDEFDNIWAGVQDEDGTRKGVISLGNRGTVPDSTIRYHITETDGLPGSDIRSIVVDRDNDIWVGTDRGVGIILDTENPRRPGGIASYRPLSGGGVVVNTIAVDPLNQKWVGTTTEGAVLLSPDGTQVLAVYNVASTGGKIISNDIKSIAIDGKTGTVYFGTLFGLASLTTTAITPRTDFDKLVIAPNPFILPSSTPLTVDGLVENSSIKILSIDGRVIRDIRTPGGRIGFWDGKDQDGIDVSSGVYIVAAYSEDGSKVATGKVAVIRR